MKHLYFLCNNGVASSYGVGTYMKQLALALKNEAFLLSIVMMQSDKKVLQVEYNSSIRYIYIPSVLDMSLYGEKKAYSKKVITYLLYPYIDNNAKNIFLFNFADKVDFVKLLKHYWSNSKIVYVVHFMDYDGRISMDELLFLNSVDHLICLSKVTMQKLIEEYEIPQKKVSLIYNGIEDRYQHISKGVKLAIRRKYFIHPKDKILLFVGRIDLFKGVDLLIEVMRHLLLWNENIRLFIVGDGLLDIYLKKCIPLWSHISFTGKLSEDELRDLYMICDLGVIPSLQEQCSFVGIEMMMFGIPTIVSDAPGLDEMFDNQISYIYKIPYSKGKDCTQDCIRWTHAIKKALTCTEQVTKIHSQIRMCYKDKFKLKNMKTGYTNLFNTLFNI